MIPNGHDILFPATLQELGYTIDKSTYPWFAYKGPRFSPTIGFTCHTPAWSRTQGELS